MLDGILSRHELLLKALEENTEDEVLDFWNHKDSELLTKYLAGKKLTDGKDDIQAEPFFISNIIISLFYKKTLNDFLDIFIKNVKNTDALNFAYSTLIYDPRVDLIESQISSLKYKAFYKACKRFLKAEGAKIEEIWRNNPLLKEYLTVGVNLEEDGSDKNVITCDFDSLISYFEKALESGYHEMIDSIWENNPSLHPLYTFRLTDKTDHDKDKIDHDQIIFSLEQKFANKVKDTPSQPPKRRRLTES